MDPEQNNYNRIITPDRVANQLSAKRIAESSRQIYHQLIKFDSVLSRVLAGLKTHDLESLSTWKYVILASIGFGLVLWSLIEIKWIITGEFVLESGKNVLTLLGFSSASIHTIYLIGTVGISLVFGIGIWMEIAEYGPKLPISPRSSAAVATEIHKTEENGSIPEQKSSERNTPTADVDQLTLVAISHSVKNIMEEYEIQLWENLYGDETKLRRGREYRRTNNQIDLETKDIRIAELVSRPSEKGDEYRPSTDPGNVLDHGPGDQQSPISNIVGLIATAPYQIHVQVISTPEIGGESNQNQHINRLGQDGQEPADQSRAGEIETATGRFMKNTVRILIETPTESADEWAKEAIGTMTNEIQKLTANGVFVDRQEGSTRDQQSRHSRMIENITQNKKSIDISAACQRYQDREINRSATVTMEAKTSLLLHAVPGDGGDVTDQAIGVAPINEVPETSLTPGARYELRSGYDPAQF